VIKEIATYIESKVTDLTINTNFFVGWKPVDSVAKCSWLIESGGKPDGYLKDRGEFTMQVLSRGESYFEARMEAYKIFDVLNTGAGLTLPDLGSGVYMANAVEAVNFPQSLGEDEKGYWLFSTNYILRIGES